MRSRFRSRLLLMNYNIKTKLIGIFIVMKVIPLILIGWLAWYQILQLADRIEAQSVEMVLATQLMVGQVGELAVNDSVKALDVQATEKIEHMTTDTAKSVAAFLYDRDKDIKMIAQLDPNEETYGKLITTLTKSVTEHGEWKFDVEKAAWVPVVSRKDDDPYVRTKVKENEKDWHYRKPEARGKQVELPLYLEVTFVDLAGNEKIKVTSSELLTKELRNVADKGNTWCKAETYFEKLAALKPGEIYVSDVIGAYVGSPIIGPYTFQAAKERGIPFEPEKAAYAGKENPVGIRFRGLIRWATPVMKDEQVIGYVTIALDQRHLSEFTDHIIPTEKRYSDIADAHSGNYAFIWDYKGRSIVHPRHHSIVGYDPATGEPAIPWLEESIYTEWQASGLPVSQFLETVPTFHAPSQKKRPAAQLTKNGFIGLDGRYLNFAPQCTGWHELTENGGSGSFLIFWTGLWKLTTAATIPYYTGQYGDSPRGFGYVTIGANVDEFHRSANETANHIQSMVTDYSKDIDDRQRSNRQIVSDTLKQAFRNLTASTMIMIFFVIIVAIWMATFLTRRIQAMIQGIHLFQKGNFAARLQISSNDEMGDLANAFNTMAKDLENSIKQLEAARRKADKANELLEQKVEERTYALKEMNGQLQEEINERKRAEETIKQLAYYDSLTGLPNRMMFQERLLEELMNIKQKHGLFAVLFLDLDGFKKINDSYGHAVGDRVLCEVARRLEEVMQKKDTVSRLGGDEFAIIATDVADMDDAVSVAKKILAKLNSAIIINGKELFVGASVGMSISPIEGEDMDTLLKKADTAMYQMKKSNRE